MLVDHFLFFANNRNFRTSQDRFLHIDPRPDDNAIIKYQIDFAVDLSDRVDTMSLSGVYRF